MKPSIRMIGLDLDGTVFNSQKQVTPRTAAAITAACRAGIVVLPATGRQLSGVPRAFTDIEGVVYALTANGARICEIATGKLLYQDAFSSQEGLRMVRLAERYRVFNSVFVGGECYANQAYYDYLAKINPGLRKYIQDSRVVVGDLYTAVAEDGRPVEKLSMVFDNEAERAAAWQAFEAESVAVTSSIPMNLEVNTATANKGAGLLALGDILGIRREEIMAIGDASNDIDMLRAVGHGVAMGNAGPEVKAVADAVTLSNDEDGVALAIEALL